MVGKRCAAKTCFNTPATRPNLKFFTFPKVEWYARVWAEACGRPDLTNKTMEMLTRYVLCSEHFEDHWFLNSKHKAAFIRTDTPIPTIFRDNLSEHMIRRFGRRIAKNNAATLKENATNLGTEVELKDNEQGSELLYTSDPGLKQEEHSFGEDIGKLTISLVENVGDTGEQKIHKFCRLCACLVPANLLASIFEMHLDIKINKLLPESLHVFKEDGLPEELCGSCIEKLTICDETIQEFLNADNKLRDLRRTHKQKNKIITPSFKVPNAQESQQFYYVNQQSGDGQNVLPNNIMQFVEVNTAAESGANVMEIKREVDNESNILEAKTEVAFSSLRQQPEIINQNLNHQMNGSGGISTLPDIAVTDSDLNFQRETVQKTQDNSATSSNQTNETMVYKCMDCSQEFMSTDVLLEHSLHSHQVIGSDHQVKYCMVKRKVVKGQRIKRYKCIKCSADFSGNRAYRAHLRSHLSRSSMCEYCGIYFMLKSQLDSHRRLHTKETPYHCGVCGESFIFRNSYRRHKKSHTETKPAKECEECKKTFTSVSLLKKHEKTHENDRGVLCSLCGKVLATPQSLRVHLKTHNEDRPFACTICLKRFRTSSQLNHHNQTHRKDKRFECTECHKKFHMKGLLRQHMNSHSGIKPYPCDICGTRFNRLGNLGQHKKKHAMTTEETEETSIKCQICNKRLKSEFTFKHHMAKHNGEKKPYSCEVCEKRFMTLVQWKVHRRLHTGERPYVCSVCCKPFRSDATMKQHYLTFHTDNFPHQCPYCERRFKRLQSLIVHKKTHTGERPFPCAICGRAFAQKGDMMKHMKIHGQGKGRALSEIQNQVYIQEQIAEETVIQAIEAEHITVLTLGDTDIGHDFLITIPNVEVETEMA